MAHTYHGPSGRYVDSSHSRQRRLSYQPYGEDEAIHAYPERFTYDVPNVRSQRMTSHQDRPEYVGRRTTRAIVHDTSRNTDKERKRISVAVSRLFGFAGRFAQMLIDPVCQMPQAKDQV